MVHRIVQHLTEGFRYSRYDCDFAQRKPRLELRSVGDFGIRL